MPPKPVSYPRKGERITEKRFGKGLPVDGGTSVSRQTVPNPLFRDPQSAREHAAMMHRSVVQIPLLLTLGFAGPALAQGSTAPAPESHAAKLYEKQCYSCHNIGGGDKKGPDLMDLLKRRDRTWATQFILTPMAMKNAGDKEAVALFNKYAPEEMPDQMLAPDQVEEIFELIETLSKTKKTFVPTSGRLSRRPTPRDIPAGERLFTGQTRLAKGGAACISCHSVTGIGYLGGGMLGPDLTDSCRRYTEVELASILKAPAFPTMSRMYGKHPLSGEEAVQIYAYLYAAREKAPDDARATSHTLGWGVAGMLAVFGAMSFLWRGRLHPSKEGRR
jgi:mono/diheme cytochrome c family protein